SRQHRRGQTRYDALLEVGGEDWDGEADGYGRERDADPAEEPKWTFRAVEVEDCPKNAKAVAPGAKFGMRAFEACKIPGPFAHAQGATFVAGAPCSPSRYPPRYFHELAHAPGRIADQSAHHFSHLNCIWPDTMGSCPIRTH